MSSSHTFYRYTGGSETLSCTVFDNGDWELFKETQSLAHHAARPGSATKKRLSRDAMGQIAEEKFDRYLSGEEVGGTGAAASRGKGISP